MKKILLCLLNITFIAPIISMELTENEKAFFQAILADDIDKVNELIASGINIDMQDKDGDTPLIVAMTKKNPNKDIITAILNEVPNTTIKNKDNKTAMIHVQEIKNNDLKKLLTDLLVKAQNQFDLYQQIKQKKFNSDISDIKNFIATNPIISLNVTNMDRNPLHNAIVANNLQLVNFLIEEGANVNLTFTGKVLGSKIERGISYLMIAILLGNSDLNMENNREIIKSLLQNNANTNAKMIAEDVIITPILAALREKPDLIKLLVEHKADINSPITIGGRTMTVLMAAAENGDFGIVQEFLKLGADPSINEKGKTALDLANEGLNKVINELKTPGLDEEARKGVEQKKKDYEEIIKVLEKAITELPTKPLVTTQQLLPSFQNLIQKLNVLQKWLAKKII